MVPQVVDDGIPLLPQFADFYLELQEQGWQSGHSPHGSIENRAWLCVDPRSKGLCVAFPTIKTGVSFDRLLVCLWDGSSVSGKHVETADEARTLLVTHRLTGEL